MKKRNIKSFLVVFFALIMAVQLVAPAASAQGASTTQEAAAVESTSSTQDESTAEVEKSVASTDERESSPPTSQGVPSGSASSETQQTFELQPASSVEEKILQEPSVAPKAAQGKNLALGATVICGSVPENASMTKEKLVDGDYNSRFSTSKGNSNPITLDLGESHEINSVRLFWEVKYCRDYQISVSEDNENYTIVASVANKPNRATDYLYFAPVTARYVRLNHQTYSNMSIFEFQVYNISRVNENYSIQSIQTDQGNLAPLFNRDEFEYEIHVGKETESLKLTATLKNPDAEQNLTMNSQVVQSGTPFEIDLDQGANQVAVTSTDPENNEVYETYTITINRLDFDFGTEMYQNIVQKAKVDNPTKFKVTSTVSGAWAPLSNLTDGNRYTVYQPELSTPGTPWGVMLDFGGNYMVNQVKFISNPGSYLDGYDLYASQNGTDWTKVGTEQNGNGENRSYSFSPLSTRYVKVDGKKAVSYSSMAEIEVYGVDISINSILNALAATKVSRGQTKLDITVPAGYTVVIASTSDAAIIDGEGKIYPLKNQQQTVKIIFEVQDVSTGYSKQTSEITLVVPPLVDIKSIPVLKRATVEYGTPLQQVSKNYLPKTILATLSDDTEESLPVVWQENSTPLYDEGKSGLYTFKGTVQLGVGITNDESLPLEISQEITVGELTLKNLFITPEDQRLPVPHGGRTKRTFFVHANKADGPLYSDVTWALQEKLDFVSISEKGMITVLPSDARQAGETMPVAIVATDKNSDITASATVTLFFSPNGQSEPSPLEKEGYTLFHSSEFNGTDIDRTAWSDYYLRHWAIEGDESTRTDMYFEDESIIIKIDENSKPWSPLDGNVLCYSLMSFEKPAIHKFHNQREGRNIPIFDGTPTTKYGYYEMRAKLPAATDGSHMAWWMTGTQEDQNIFEAQVSGVSNQRMEIDVHETSFKEGIDNKWHSCYIGWGSQTEGGVSGGTSDRSVVFDPTKGRLDSEFHNYGMLWDENGLKFYIDGAEIPQKEVKVKIDHRLLNYLGIYANAWGGADMGIYPKEFAIDYFRIYKANGTEGIPNDIYFDMETVPQKLLIPAAGETTAMKIDATVVDQMHTPVEADLEWYFASDQAFIKETTVKGVTIDRNTGRVSVSSDATPGIALRVCAKVKGNHRVRQSYRVILDGTQQAPIPMSIFFKGAEKINEISAGNSVALNAALYNQYLEIMPEPLNYSIVLDTPGDRMIAPTGVSIQEGKLVVGANAQVGQVFYVHARSQNGEISGNFVVRVTAGKPADKYYSVSYNIGAATGTAGKVTAKVGQPITLHSGKGLLYKNHRLDGWAHNGTTYPAGGTFTSAIEGDILMTAIWVSTSSSSSSSTPSSSSAPSRTSTPSSSSTPQSSSSAPSNTAGDGAGGGGQAAPVPSSSKSSKRAARAVSSSTIVTPSSSSSAPSSASSSSSASESEAAINSLSNTQPALAAPQEKTGLPWALILTLVGLGAAATILAIVVYKKRNHRSE